MWASVFIDLPKAPQCDITRSWGWHGCVPGQERWEAEDERKREKVDDLVFLELFLGSFIFPYNKRFAWSAGYPYSKFKT